MAMCMWLVAFSAACCSIVQARQAEPFEPLVRKALSEQLGLADSASQGQCLVQTIGTDTQQQDSSPMGVAQLLASDANRASIVLAASGCVDAALRLVQVMACAQDTLGRVPRAVFLRAPSWWANGTAGHEPAGTAPLRAVRGLVAAFQEVSEATSSVCDLVVSAEELVSSLWVPVDAAWPGAEAVARLHLRALLSTARAASPLSSQPGFGRAVAAVASACVQPGPWAWDRAAAPLPQTAERGPGLGSAGRTEPEGASSSPAEWAAVRAASAWLRASGLGAASRWLRFLSRSRALHSPAQAGAAPAAALVASLHAWETALPSSSTVARWACPPPCAAWSCPDAALLPPIPATPWEYGGGAPERLLGDAAASWGAWTALNWTLVAPWARLPAACARAATIFADPAVTAAAVADAVAVADACGVLDGDCSAADAGAVALAWRTGLSAMVLPAPGGTATLRTLAAAGECAADAPGGAARCWQLPDGRGVLLEQSGSETSGLLPGLWALAVAAAGDAAERWDSALAAPPSPADMAPLASLLPAALLITEALGGGALGRGGFAPTSLSTRSALFNASLALQGPVVTAQVGWALAAARRAGWFDWGQTALAAAQAALRWNNRSAAEAPAGSGAGERWPAAWAIDGDAVGSLRPLPGSTLSSDASGLLAAAELVIPPGECGAVVHSRGTPACPRCSLHPALATGRLKRACLACFSQCPPSRLP